VGRHRKGGGGRLVLLLGPAEAVGNAGTECGVVREDAVAGLGDAGPGADGVVAEGVCLLRTQGTVELVLETSADSAVFSSTTV
jgi:hypothetical protein